MRSEKLHSYLEIQQIDWRFNLSQAPRWGGQFERLIDVVKQSLFRCVGKANLNWSELEEVLLAIETNHNNRSLSYVEDHVEMPILTSNLMLYGQHSKYLLDEDEISPDNKTFGRKAKYLK